MKSLNNTSETEKQQHTKQKVMRENTSRYRMNFKSYAHILITLHHTLYHFSTQQTSPQYNRMNV